MGRAGWPARRGASRTAHQAIPARALRRGRVRAAHRLREPRQSPHRARERAAARDRDSPGARRGSWAPRPVAAHGKRAAIDRRWRGERCIRLLGSARAERGQPGGVARYPTRTWRQSAPSISRRFISMARRSSSRSASRCSLEWRSDWYRRLARPAHRSLARSREAHRRCAGLPAFADFRGGGFWS